ncbi:MAG: transferrin-binding protein-like solute binding protein [Cardiobacteriaceae bacterium]|nr:transferrin-binding protein-like solute binding protein [Cardiobacteriaceae bacterium]
MKLSNLSLAILVAVGVAACGGSDNNDAPKDPQTPQTPQEPQQPDNNANNTGNSKDVDPTQTKVVDGITLNESSTVTGQHYVRHYGSTFDRSNNPSQTGSGTALGSVNLNQQNPSLTNLVGGRVELVKVDGTPVGAEFLGSYSNDPTDADSLQTENAKNVLVAAPGDAAYAGNEFANVGVNSGLVAIANTAATNHKTVVFGSEDTQQTTSRIFGRYYLANNDVVNSYRSLNFATIDTSATPATVSLHIANTKLDDVQYGRVSGNMDLEAPGATIVPHQGKNFQRQPFAAKNDNNAVDYYFYRGTNETTLAQMAALPTDYTINYQGHALMYGLDNSYHGLVGGANGGAVQQLPNAFAPGSTAGSADAYGFGNFVEANLNMATKKLDGVIYNAWVLDSTKPQVTQDTLVTFKGDVTGNTVVGTADRAYLAGEDNAVLKASFFGANADELGGAINSVTGNYGEASWGGVFGAERTTYKSSTQTTNPNSNAWQVEDGNRVYTP